MKSFLLLLTFFISTVSGSAQISFQQGYFIDNNGTKTECLLKNIDWRYNPVEFQYKLSENHDVKVESIANVKEFASLTDFKFIKANVDIDKSSELVNKISNKWEPDFFNEQVFLQVLVEGEASLYVYKSANFTRFFFKVGTSPIEQLIYKIYNDKGNFIKENNSYRQQLLENLKCEIISFKDLQIVDYSSKDLEKVFVEYNNCMNQTHTVYKDPKKWKEGINIHLRPGLNYSSLSLEDSNINYRNSQFDNAWNVRIGVELEFIMNFNKNKWSVFVEPTYINYKADGKILPNSPSINTPPIELSVEHSAIEIPLGIRHYMYLNNDLKLFIDFAYINDFSLKSEYSYNENFTREIEIKDRVGLGFGVKLKNKYGAQLRYSFSNGGKNAIIADYNYLGLILNYTIFSGSN